MSIDTATDRDQRTEGPTAGLPRHLVRVGAIGVGLIVIGLAAQSMPTETGRAVLIIASICAAIAVRVDIAVLALLFVFLAADDPSSRPYNDLWQSPIQGAADFFFFTVGRSVPGFEIPAAPMVIIPLVLLARAATGRTGAGLRRRPTNRLSPVVGLFVTLGLAATAAMLVWGLARGGSIRHMYLQVYGIVILLSLLGTVARIGDSTLARRCWHLVLAVGLYRATLAVFVYLTEARALDAPPLYLTSHADSITWTLCIVYLAARLLERPDVTMRVAAVGAGAWIGLAVVVNNRRLAWVMIAAAVAYTVVTAIGPARRRLRQILAVAAPLLVAYVAAGWVAPPSRYLAPAQSLKSVVSGDDRSSQTRSIEDFNLLFTVRSSFPFPNGFGHEYVEWIVADDISAAFEQYRYLPHNSVLGLLTMIGPIGLALVVVPLVLAVHASHRTLRRHSSPRRRVDAAMVVGAWISFLAFAWGDLGFFTPQPTAVMGIVGGLGLAIASRVSQSAPHEQASQPSPGPLLGRRKAAT